MEYVSAMAQIFQRAQARGLALETVARWVEDEGQRMLVDKDSIFRNRLTTARERLHGQEMTDRELLLQVRGLYDALGEARGRAPGGMRG